MLLSRLARLSGIIILTLCLLCSFTGQAGTASPSLLTVSEALDSHKCIKGTAAYEVMLPSSPDPVTYTIHLMSSPAQQADTLAPCDYLISWSLPRPKGVSKGFTAYYDGNHFRYRDLKLQEYHYAEDPTPFSIGKGVQNQAQFTELLPAYMARTLRMMATDSGFTYTMRETPFGITVTGKCTMRGYDAYHFDYTFDNNTKLPKSIDIVYNPASISEQTISIKFDWQPDGTCTPISEAAIVAKWPDVFEKFRTSNFRVESLVGADLPEFTSQAIGRDRYVHHHGDSFSAPTVIVFLDPEVTTAAETVEAVRTARSAAPVDFNIIFAFPSSDKDSVMALVGETGGSDDGETVLLNARSLQRDCGVNSFPTLIFSDADGRVKQLQTSYNKDLSSIVIQKIQLCN